ncbi:hypothetical protein RBS60_06070 [Sinomonas sp. ASV486]|uniref:Uncharacterized protein n=1 Tax=Sinomonas puerhi TaxID=3238584 RepID=A0AB39L7H1_9MICC|nr:hypothetical protein [Sinomonas sp. ASV486]MDQ4489763.1 hypothetical protein [Sinomonas sp. ASV486]
MSGHPDPDGHDAAPDDDAWRDLVARLGGGPSGDEGGGPAPREPSAAERAAAGAPPRGHRPRSGLIHPDAPSNVEPTDGDPGALGDDGAGFSRFDPLGISGGRSESSGSGVSGRGPAGDEHDGLPGDFVPDEPEPVLAGADPVSVLAWSGALGGPVALLVCALVWRGVPGFVIVLLVAAFIAGVGTLIMRLPRNKDDDGDDGARI